MAQGKCFTCGLDGLGLEEIITHDCAPRRDPGHRVALCTARPGTWPAGIIDYEPAGSGWLTTEHPASSYGQPVLVVEGIAYGAGDAAARGWIVATHEPGYCAEPELCAAWRAGDQALVATEGAMEIKHEKAALFLEQTLITDVPLRVVRAAAALAPDHSAVAGRLLAGIEAAARHDAASGLRHVGEARRLWAVEEAARRLCAR